MFLELNFEAVRFDDSKSYRTNEVELVNSSSIKKIQRNDDGRARIFYKEGGHRVYFQQYSDVMDSLKVDNIIKKVSYE